MLSKSLGQIIRVSAAMHIIFHLESDELLRDVISNEAIDAAIILWRFVANIHHI